MIMLSEIVAVGWDDVRRGFLRALRGAGYAVRLVPIADVTASPVGPGVVLVQRDAVPGSLAVLIARLRIAPGGADARIVVVHGADDAEARCADLELGADDAVIATSSRDWVARIAAHARTAARLATLARMSLVDEMTGVLNRRGIMQRLTAELSRCRRARRPVAVLAIDVDRLKIVNDTLGHAVGDQVIATVARCLAGAIRESDAVGRVGGDEFVVVLPDADAAAGAEVARRIHRAVAASVVPALGRAPSVSIGVCAGSGPAAPILAGADGDLYQQKRARPAQLTGASAATAARPRARSQRMRPVRAA